MNVNRRPKRLGEILIDEGLITQDQLRISLIEQKKTGDALGKVFVNLGFVTDSALREAIGQVSGQKTIDLSSVIADKEALALIPKEVALRYGVLPITYDHLGATLTVAMEDVFNIVALDKIASLLDGKIEITPLASTEAELKTAIDQFYGYDISVEGVLQELEGGRNESLTLKVDGVAYSHPLVRLVDALLSDAVKRGASDVHFEPEHGFLRIRYRVDGVLRQVRAVHINYWAGMVVRLKVMSTMDIAETRAPQDGRFSLNISGRNIDFRVSAHPTSHGENFVLRILDRAASIVSLDKIGLSEESLMALKIMMARPEGIVLVTGPTGSGKTTTLYSMLNYINTESVNIMTLEDPVEYPMSMIRQTSVSEAAKLDFANGIRSLMRQDPDIIFVGEIRDEDTAEMAFRAAMTGHQVYSTLHTNSALGVIPRLLDIGIQPNIISGNIIGIVAQRLVRRLCPYCKEAYRPSEMEIQLLGQKNASATGMVYKAVGCDHCEQGGYKGRFAVLEILRFDTHLDDLIARRATLVEIEKLALDRGFKTLADDASRRVWDGETSLDEVSRVIDLTKRLN